jgi:hypothetical protein
MQINPKIFLSPFLLNIPAIRFACVRPIFDPYPTPVVNVPLLSSLRAVGNDTLLDNLFPPLIPVQLRNKGSIPGPSASLQVILRWSTLRAMRW